MVKVDNVNSGEKLETNDSTSLRREEREPKKDKRTSKELYLALDESMCACILQLSGITQSDCIPNLAR